MAEIDLFAEGMRAYRQEDYATAIAALSGLEGRDDLPGQLARYYCGMAQRALGIEMIQARRYPEAARHLLQASALLGKTADLAEHLLVVYAKTRQYDRCETQADALAQLDPDEPAARVRFAQAQWRNGQRPLAMMTLTEALRRFGDQAELHLHLGLFHAALDEYDQACQHLTRAAHCDPSSARAFRYLGLAHAASGDCYQAAQAFQRAWWLQPEDLALAHHLCLAADAAAQAGKPVTVALPECRRGATDSQIGQLAEYAASEPDFVDALLSLPPTDGDAELMEVIVSVLKTALVNHGNYADLHCFAAIALERLGQLEQAHRHAAKAVEINPRYFRALLQLAKIELGQESKPQAIAHLRQAAEHGADWPDVHIRLGDLLLDVGMADQAKTHYRRALELNRDCAQASEALERLAA